MSPPVSRRSLRVDARACYLRGLVWDGIGRVELVPAAFLGDGSAPTNALFRRWMVDAVTRTFRPGASTSTGPIVFIDGGGASVRFLQELFGGDEVLSPHELPLINGAWCACWEGAESVGVAHVVAACEPGDNVLLPITHVGAAVVRSDRWGVGLDDVPRVRVGRQTYDVSPWRDQLWAEAVAHYGGAEP